jgi:hypothetical protein
MLAGHSYHLSHPASPVRSFTKNFKNAHPILTSCLKTQSILQLIYDVGITLTQTSDKDTMKKEKPNPAMS